MIYAILYFAIGAILVLIAVRGAIEDETIPRGAIVVASILFIIFWPVIIIKNTIKVIKGGRK